MLNSRGLLFLRLMAGKIPAPFITICYSGKVDIVSVVVSLLDDKCNCKVKNKFGVEDVFRH